ncbi:ABC transporter ATP-binding protein [Prevotella sp. oral taxon 475]|nr:ABC transporter ATP-binding protein [Prevotella sp. oral taxon 475]QUB47659.1 ABC transporter ATP-binding protein [Prevotella sp. oral taxon 475]
MKLKRILQHRYALSSQGATDLMKACLASCATYIVLMMPVGLLYYLVADLIQGGTIATPRAVLYGLGAVLCLLFIALTTRFQYNATFFATYVESGIRRVTLAERLRKLPLSFFGKKDLADLTSRMMADCATLETASSHYIPQFFGSLLSLIPISVGLFLFDWQLALAALWPLPVCCVIMVFAPKLQNRLGRRQMAAKMACADGIQECLEALRDLRANNAEETYMQGLDTKIKAVERRAFISELGLSAFVVSAQMILRFGIVSVALVGSILLTEGRLDVLTFFAFLLTVSRLYDPLSESLIHLAALITLNVQTERMNEILEHPLQEGSDRLSNQGFDIVFSHVSFAYDAATPVLSDVSFTARQGEVTAIIGPSGGGKTTISRLAARFWDIPQPGKITVGGMDIATIDPERLLSLYSIVFQDVTLFNNSILENIRIGRKNATDEEVMAAARLAHCDEFVELLPQGWHTQIGENGAELSGGERQRLSLARAFLKDAPIILLDEATASLDVENETMIQEALSRLIRNKTVLIIAHRLRTVAGADNIVVLSEGCVVQQGTAQQLYQETDGLYREMVEKQRT